MKDTLNIPSDSLVVPHNRTAEERFVTFLRGGKIPPEWHDLREVSGSTRERVFRTSYLDSHCPKLPGQRREKDFVLAAQEAKWNPPTVFYSKKDVLAPNNNLVDGERLAVIEQRAIQRLRQLQHYLTGKKPVILLDYFDESDPNGCFTTPMLVRTLRAVLGDAYDDLVSDDHRANFRSGKDPIVNRSEAYLRRLKAATATGGIVLAGGTFSDADDVHGRFFREQVMEPLSRNSNIRFCGVCWSYQVEARTIAESLEIPLHVLSGALKFGVFPIRVLNEGPFRTMLDTRDRIATITGVCTHGDHVVPGQVIRRIGDMLVGPDYDKGSMKVIAWDPLTRQPYGFQSNDGRIVCVAFHPEVMMIRPRGSGLSDDLESIREFVGKREIRRLLGDSYDIDAEHVADNFSPRVSGSSLVKHDLAEPFYASLLDYFASSLMKSFGIRLSS